jgi:hypothetical protein
MSQDSKPQERLGCGGLQSIKTTTLWPNAPAYRNAARSSGGGIFFAPVSVIFFMVRIYFLTVVCGSRFPFNALGQETGNEKSFQETVLETGWKRASFYSVEMETVLD